MDVTATPALAAAELGAALDAERESRLSDATRRSIAYICRHYGDRVRLADLAAASATTPFALIRAFRRDVGTTPHAFLVRVRVAAATRLLAANALPIAAIATAVGFVDQTHMTRHFKRTHGRTPARHQALMRAGAADGRYGAAAC
jgi:AraC-like DNA-binding protein